MPIEGDKFADLMAGGYKFFSFIHSTNIFECLAHDRHCLDASDTKRTKQDLHLHRT